MSKRSAKKTTIAPAKTPATPTAAGPRMEAAPRRTARGFDAGQTGRRLRAIPSTGVAINAQVSRYGRTIVARSRYLAANNPYAQMAKESFVSALVGAGIKPSPLSIIAVGRKGESPVKHAINAAWRKWTDEADADGLTDFYGMQTLIGGELFEAGECFIRFRDRRNEDGLSVPLQLQLLPSEMLDPTYNEVIATGRIQCGIEFDKIGRRVAYWFYRNMPGDMMQQPTIGNNRFRVPASQVMHLFRPIRAGQIRGVPHTLSGMVTLAMLDLYDDAELERKRIAALFGAFVGKSLNANEEVNPFDNGTGGEAHDASNPADVVLDFDLEPGAVIELPEGYDVKFAEPADVGGAYEMFQLRMLLRAAAGFGVPYADMTGDLRQTSYGSIRAGLVAFRRRVEAMQHQVMAFQFCRPVWLRWFNAAMSVRAISGITATAFTAAPDLFTVVKWIPPKWEWVDPLKDRQAEKLAVDSGFKPRSDVVEAEGYDPEENDIRIKQDQDRAKQLGLKFVTLKTEIIISPSDDDFAEEDPAAPPKTGADRVAALYGFG
jgi:lambda family phage portal protein